MTTSTSRYERSYTTTEYGKQNMFALNHQIEVLEDYNYSRHAEQLNGPAMIGFFAAVHNYILFGAVIYLLDIKRSLTPPRTASYF